MEGRPPIYTTPEELQEKIDDYFKNGVESKPVVVGKGDGKTVIDIPVPTITGLCLYCGFESRQSFYDYEKREQFSYIIKKARLFVEKHYEELLQVGNTTGAIFALKNMGWIDRVNQDVTTNGKDVQQSIDPNLITKLIDKL
jgi:hypothetical protein